MRTILLVSMALLVLFGALFLIAWLQLGKDNLFGLPVPANIENGAIMLLSGIAIARLAYAIHTIEHPRHRPATMKG